MTLGDPRGVGPEVVRKAVARPEVAETASFVFLGPESETRAAAAMVDGRAVSVGRWPPSTPDPKTRPAPDGDPGEEPEEGEAAAGRLAAAAVERGIELALAGRVDGLVTAPLTKRGLAAAGLPYPGHTELLRDRTGVEEVTMMMTAEETPLGGALRLALLTVHLPLREVTARLTGELVVRRTLLAIGALREWWKIERPRLAFSGVNPHASEDGLFGDEEARILAPAIERIAARDVADVTGIHPADTVFRRCLDGRADLVVVPYHDVGLAVLKTVALERGVNVTAGLPFPRTSPDHGTALGIAGRGVADPGSMIQAIRLCARFARAGAGER